MASKKLCEFWKPDLYGPGEGGCCAAGEEGNIVCLTEGQLGGKSIPDCMSYPFGITADRDRERARAEAAEKRVADLELHEQSVDEELFHVLWIDYGSAPDDTLAPSGLKLKRKLREWVGIDAANDDAERLAGALEKQWPVSRDAQNAKGKALRAHEARKEKA